MNIDAIPNPSGSLDALTTADLERLALDPGLALFAFLIDEISEVGPDHTHHLGGGIPKITLARLDWSVAFGASVGELEAQSGGTQTFDRHVIADD